MNIKDIISNTQQPINSAFKQVILNGQTLVKKELGFNIQHQTQNNWCWSAVSTSVSVFYWSSSTWTQCKVASTTLNRTDCCNSPVPSPCNVPYYLNLALTTTNNYVSYTGAIAFSQIESEINAGRPIGARIGWSGGGGHFVVIYGYTVSGSTNYLYIGDPIYGNSYITLDNFTNHYQGSGTWTTTYYTKSYKPHMNLRSLQLSDALLNEIRRHQEEYKALSANADSWSKSPSIGLVHSVYTLGLSALQEHQAPAPYALRAVELAENKLVAAYDLDESQDKILQYLSSSPIVSQFSRALEVAGRLPHPGDAEWELRLLNIPALNVQLLWLHQGTGDQDIVIPLNNFGGLTEFQSTSYQEALQKLREAATQLNRSDEMIGS